MKKIVIFILGSAAVAGIVYAVIMKNREAAPVSREIGGVMVNFKNPKKSAHYESNTPEHGAVLAAAPVNVVIDFNFDLAGGSEISIINDSDGKEYGSRPTFADPNKLAMRRSMDQSAPDGLYNIDYKACWPDGSCHTGNFQFAIDRTMVSSYLDWRNKKEVAVVMSGIQFQPANILINKGTKVIWKNEDSAIHYVNTDSHPAHTYYLEQNSQALNKGDSYEVTFNFPGVYPYHCSAHAGNMRGSIIVE